MSSECPNIVITRNLGNQERKKTIPHNVQFLSKLKVHIHITGVVQHTRQPDQIVLDLNNHF